MVVQVGRWCDAGGRVCSGVVEHGPVADSGNPANLWYYSILVVGLVGACLGRLKAPALARTLFVMAATLAVIGLTLPSGAPPYLARNMGIGHAVNAMLFTAAGLLFRHASFRDEVRP